MTANNAAIVASGTVPASIPSYGNNRVVGNNGFETFTGAAVTFK